MERKGVNEFGSEHTKRAYETDVRMYIGWCNEQCLEPSEEVSGREYIRMMKLKYKRNTVNRRLCALRKVFGFKIKSLRQEKKILRILADWEVDQVRDYLRYPKKGSGNTDRNYLIFEILLQTGIRSEELLKIQMCDINTRDGKIEINGKGNKKRTVYMNKKLVRLMKKYRLLRAAMWADEGYLFPNLRCTRGLRKMIERMVKKTGMKRFSAHDIRATFATNLRVNGSRLEIIQKLLGHEDIKTTMGYIGVNESEVTANLETKLSYNEGWDDKLPSEVQEKYTKEEINEKFTEFMNSLVKED